MIEFGIRNLTLYFKDRSAVILSFLAEGIVIILYALFMRDNLVESFPGVRDADLLMDVWMMAGVIGITPVTTALGAYGVMIDDKMRKIDRDFTTWPVSRWSILGGYLFSAAMVGMFMSFLLLMMTELYFFQRFDLWPGAEQMLYQYFVLGLNSFVNAAMALLLVSFLKTANALAACCTILGALIGFLTGIYLPMGSLPESVQWIVKSFPVSHGVALLRQTMTTGIITDTFGKENTAAIQTFMEYMGIRYQLDGIDMTETDSIVFLSVSACICIAAAGIRYSHGKRRHRR